MKKLRNYTIFLLLCATMFLCACITVGNSRERIKVSGEIEADVGSRHGVLSPENEQSEKFWPTREKKFREENFTLRLPRNKKLELIWVKPGSFTMGSPPDEGHRHKDEHPRKDDVQHLVVLTKGFWLGKYEVTQDQWEAVMRTNLRQQHDLANLDPDSYGEGGNYPMYYVNWEEAMEFCNKLTERERNAGRIPRGYEFSLPTEAQWEYACRAGTTGPYHTGSGKCALSRAGWWHGNSGDRSHPVGKKQPNSWGFYDMHGNVEEWCYDWLESYATETVTDPTGPSIRPDPMEPEGGPFRVLRGGSWFFYARSADRNGRRLGNRINDVGFRLSLRAVP